MEASFPSTRFIGSKVKIIEWIWDSIKDLDFSTVLDAFGGTGCFSFISKKNGKRTFFNDVLSFNYNVGLAIIENSRYKVSSEEVDIILLRRQEVYYRNFIENTFQGIYFTHDENQWLDVVTQNIHAENNVYRRALLLAALGQACLKKRPFNLFHRNNLCMRLKNVERSFNNKKCWDAPFEVLFRDFVKEYNAAVFSNGQENCAIGGLDVFELPDDFDLVYLDPPYMSRKCGVDYLAMYHFLEGLADYSHWPRRVDYATRTRRMKPDARILVWQRRSEIVGLLSKLLRKFSGSTIILSYRNDGYPSPRKISELIRMHKGRKPEVHSVTYKYALSKKTPREMLFVAE